MKKLTKLLAYVLMLVAFLGALTACNNDNDEASDGRFTPGTFTAVGTGYLGDITVEVTFSSTEILDITVVEHSDTAAFADAAFEIIPNILAAQSTDIDSISGATVTADGVLEAVADAIRQASS